jgi:hypothetical protein
MNTNSSIEKTRPIGRLLRLCFGILAFIVVIPYYFTASVDVILQSLLVMLAIIGFYVLLDIAVNQYFPNINPIWGAILANVPIILLWVLGRGSIQLGALTFLGISLIVTALRADSGCEVMSIPGLIFKRHTHLACILFSPIDWIEKKMANLIASQ